MSWLWLIPVLAVSVVLLFLVGYRRLRLFGHHVQIERTQELFLLQRERLEAQFVAGQGAETRETGWKSCAFARDLVFCRERETGQLAALITVTLELDGPNGGPTEAIGARHTSRVATAVFLFQRGHWRTSGTTILGMTPLQVLENYQGQYERLARHGEP